MGESNAASSSCCDCGNASGSASGSSSSPSASGSSSCDGDDDDDFRFDARFVVVVVFPGFGPGFVRVGKVKPAWTAPFFVRIAINLPHGETSNKSFIMSVAVNFPYSPSRPCAHAMRSSNLFVRNNL